MSAASRFKGIEIRVHPRTSGSDSDLPDMPRAKVSQQLQSLAPAASIKT